MTLYRAICQAKFTFDFTNWGSEVVIIPFQVTKRTPCGAWIDFAGTRKFVNLTAKKKYACETELEAVQALVMRKRKHISILKYQLQEAMITLETAEKWLTDQGHGKPTQPAVLGALTRTMH